MMNNKVRYEYALVDVNEGFEYESVRTRSYARELKQDWNQGYPENPVMIVQRKFKLETERKIR